MTKLGIFVWTASAVIVPAIIGFVTARPVRGQGESGASLPSFEVASIKLDKSGSHLEHAQISAERFVATGTAKGLISFAYGDGFSLRPDQISGGPDWIGSEMFRVDAKIQDLLVETEEKTLSEDQWRDQVRLMVQSLLADRFKLKVSRETKKLPVYILELAKGGPKIAPLKQPASEASSSGIFMLEPGKEKVQNAPIRNFVFLLRGIPELQGREVLDKTGLQGNYTFMLEWEPERLSNIGESSGSKSADDASRASFFTAIQEQLGLRLESAKGSVDTIVVEHIEEPSEN